MSDSTPTKETIYVDIDDEITGIIDKVRTANGKVVALVLPKRASVLQSIVNMKLLKRSAENANKNLVLVTTEAGLMPLAGSVGLFVAPTPTSKPTIPAAPNLPGDEPEDIDEPLNVSDDSASEDYDPKADAAKPVGELAGAGAAAAAAPKISAAAIDEDIDLNDDDAAAPAAAATAAAGKKAPKPKKDKKLKVPNFDTMKKKLLLGFSILALLIVGYVFAFVVLPKAVITIHTDNSTITTNLNLALDTNAKTLDTTSKTVPATAATQQKTNSQQAAATGQQNNGNKAGGSVTMSAGSCSGNVPDDISAGTTLSANSHTYVLGSNVTFNPVVSNRNCTFVGTDDGGGKAIPISALKGGADYNTSSTSFTISSRSDVSISGSANGGTDNITKIVSQSDIDGAKAKITAQDTTSIKQGLQAVLQGKDLTPITTTFLAGDPQVTTSAKAGDTADNVTVTEVTTYTMLGIKTTDLKVLVDANVNGQLDKGKQVILDDGVSKASFTQQNPATATTASVSVKTSSVAGPQIDTDALKTQVMGLKSGDIQSLIKQTPGVTEVDVKYSPFWVSSTPKKASKITIQLDKSAAN